MTHRKLIEQMLDALLDDAIESRNPEQQSAITAAREYLAQPEQSESVGKASPMPGAPLGFTVAAFKISDVPVGTKLYTRPAPLRELLGEFESLLNRAEAEPHASPNLANACRSARAVLAEARKTP